MQTISQPLCFGVKKEKEPTKNGKTKRINYKKLSEILKDFKIKDIEKLDSNEALNKLNEKVTEEVDPILIKGAILAPNDQKQSLISTVL